MNERFTPEQKVQFVEQQMDACERGDQHYIECPYCGLRTERGDVLCCWTLGKAVRAILQRQVMKELADNAERIAEAVYTGRN